MAPVASAPTYSHGKHANDYESRSHAQPPLTRRVRKAGIPRVTSCSLRRVAGYGLESGASAAGDALI